MARAIFGSLSTEDTQKRLEEKLKRTDATTKARQDANKLLRGVGAEIQPRKRVAPAQTRKKKKGKIIKIDPNVKPVTGTPSPVVAIVEGLRSAFAKAKGGAETTVAKVKEAAQSSNEKKGGKTVEIRTTAPKLPVGAQGPLPNLLNRRRAAKARKINLGGTRSDRSRGGRERPPLIPGDTRTPEQRELLAKQQRRVEPKKKSSLAKRALVAGAAGAVAGAKIARGISTGKAFSQATRNAQKAAAAEGIKRRKGGKL